MKKILALLCATLACMNMASALGLDKQDLAQQQLTCLMSKMYDTAKTAKASSPEQLAKPAVTACVTRDNPIIKAILGMAEKEGRKVEAKDIAQAVGIQQSMATAIATAGYTECKKSKAATATLCLEHLIKK
jgi:hypothetical protein